ncbi:hypothetical protein SKAU_G00077590 [Synaphobranchus kaupii]|uniref:Uncharacterized protein n=1 Tax=Synaphobranchus kaupii TaxID=118154 RepID=A0A9Q1G7Z8_SYNKA|nr:hypothetical protein SKAU_G00077590 [Synaphobranchus kaupii]
MSCQPKVTTGDNSAGYLPIIIACICIFIAIIIAIFLILRRRKRHSEGSQVPMQSNTEYASVEGSAAQINIVERKLQRPLEGSITVYETLGLPGAPPTKPESIYATVNKSAS